MDYTSLAQEIINLKNADLELRDRLLQTGQLGEGYNEEMKDLHNSNAAKLNQIMDAIAYPTIDKVGQEASGAAWLVIQHAIGRPEFMKKCLRLLEIAANEKKADPKNLAYLSDRIAILEGKPQLYGTQFDWDYNGELSPNPYDSLFKVNERRKSIGLNTLEDQTHKMREQAKSENLFPPKDLEKRKLEMDEWRRQVGWIK